MKSHKYNVIKKFSRKKKRIAGAFKGEIWIARDFDAESEEINKLFYGNS